MNAPVKIVRGTVQNLTVDAGEEEFIRSQAQRTTGAGAAIGLAAAGMAGAAVGASIAVTGGDSVEFFTCTVNGEAVRGRFSKVTFKDGDEVEVVVEPQEDGTESALAVRRKADRSLWMFPHCSRGKNAHRNFAMSAFWWIFLVLLVVVMGSYLVLGVWWHPGTSSAGVLASPDTLQFAGVVSVVMSLIAALYYSIRFFQTWKPMANRAEAILAALGYRDPTRVDLEKDHKRACKARGEGWPYLSDGPWIYRYPEDR